MPLRKCVHCAASFQSLPQVPHQLYCSQAACQQARRRLWNSQKLKVDPDYQDNKKRAQRGWMDRNPDYWRAYRSAHPEYTEKNRNRQRAKSAFVNKPMIAKIDVSSWPGIFKAGLYQVTPLSDDGARNSKLLEVRFQLVRLCPG